MSNLFFRRSFLMVCGAILAVMTCAGLYFQHNQTAQPGNGSAANDDQEPADEDEMDFTTTLRVVHPKCLPGKFTRSVSQPAYVQPYYRANLMARVAGTIKVVHKNIGDRVKAGEVVIELDVPDLVQALAHCDAQVKLAEKDAAAATAGVAVVTAADKEAKALIEEKEAEIDRALSTRKYRAAVYRRVKGLVDKKAVEPSLADERLKQMESADADVRVAKGAVKTAKFNAEEYSARVVTSKVDVEVKKARVAVAKAARDQAKAMVDYAKIRAPFDGIVVERLVDPGDFVQNASTGHPTALLKVIKADVVTLVMWVPERDAPLVTKDTEAVIKLDALRGRTLKAKVSRFSSYLDPEKGRDMRVEVDVQNKDGKLTAGMYGTMTLVLRTYEHAYLLPASAVFVRDRQAYICEVHNQHVRLVPVVVQQEDGVRVKVAKLIKRINPRTKQEEEILVDLTGNEVIVRSGQGEIRDGQEINTIVTDW